MRKTDSNGNPIPFDLSFVTCDLQRGTGGKLKTVKRARLDTRKKESTGNGNGKATQNHYQNATRNILAPNGDHVKVHIYLTTRINGKSIVG